MDKREVCHSTINVYFMPKKKYVDEVGWLEQGGRGRLSSMGLMLSMTLSLFIGKASDLSSEYSSKGFDPLATYMLKQTPCLMRGLKIS